MALKSYNPEAVNLVMGDQPCQISYTGVIVNCITGDKVNIPVQEMFNLMAWCFKFLRDILPESYSDKIVARPLNGDWSNFHAENVIYEFKGGLLPHPTMAGYYIIPNHPMRSISRNGDMISTITTRPVEYVKIGAGYLGNQTFFKGIRCNISQHRAMMYTFKGIPENVIDLEVNHIDGDKEHNAIINLEWVTRSENKKHAYETGLAPKDYCMKGILVRDARSGNVMTFRSQKECSKYMNILEKTLEYRLNHKDFSKVWADGFMFKYANDPRDWVYPKDWEADMKEQQKKISQGCKVRNCITGEVNVLFSLNEAHKIMNCARNTPKNLVRQKRYMPYEGYQIIPDDGVTEFPDFTKQQLENSFTAYSALHVESGKIIISRNQRDMANLVGVSPQVIDNYAHSPTMAFKGYRFKRGKHYEISDFN